MDSQRAVVATFMAVTFAFLSFVLVVVDWAAASGRLRRNQWMGIRIPSTMRSDRGWVAGHHAALGLMPLHLMVGVGFEPPWVRWRLGLLDFDRVLAVPFRSVEDDFELCRR
jgi:SdpI/YfhL protein family